MTPTQAEIEKLFFDLMEQESVYELTLQIVLRCGLRKYGPAEMTRIIHRASEWAARILTDSGWVPPVEPPTPGDAVH